jgi:hypothetical protein
MRLNETCHVFNNAKGERRSCNNLLLCSNLSVGLFRVMLQARSSHQHKSLPKLYLVRPSEVAQIRHFATCSCWMRRIILVAYVTTCVCMYSWRYTTFHSSGRNYLWQSQTSIELGGTKKYQFINFRVTV